MLLYNTNKYTGRVVVHEVRRSTQDQYGMWRRKGEQEFSLGMIAEQSGEKPSVKGRSYVTDYGRLVLVEIKSYQDPKGRIAR